MCSLDRGALQLFCSAGHPLDFFCALVAEAVILRKYRPMAGRHLNSAHDLPCCDPIVYSGDFITTPDMRRRISRNGRRCLAACPPGICGGLAVGRDIAVRQYGSAQTEDLRARDEYSDLSAAVPKARYRTGRDGLSEMPTHSREERQAAPYWTICSTGRRRRNCRLRSIVRSCFHSRCRPMHTPATGSRRWRGHFHRYEIERLLSASELLGDARQE